MGGRRASRPAISVGYRVEPFEHLTFGRVIAQAERLAPALSRETTPTRVGNPDLYRAQPGGSQGLSVLAGSVSSCGSITHGVKALPHRNHSGPTGPYMQHTLP